MEELRKHGDVIGYILKQKDLGKDKETIFEDLIDNHHFNGVYARSAVESIRW